MALKIRKLAYALGAEVTGVDFSKPLDDATFSETNSAFLEHCVLVFRGQPFITREQHLSFSRRFGESNDNKTRRAKHSDYPEISMVVSKPKPDGGPADAHFRGMDWHSDGSFKVCPSRITLLHAVELPEIGGDTEFANMYLAYDTLSDGMKDLIAKLEGVHIQEEEELDHSSPESLEALRRSTTTAQPLVRVHPETGRKSLYIGEKVVLLAGMTPEESRPLIDFLCAHARRPQIIYRHVWQKNDLVMWDNRCTNHSALGDFDRRNQLRHMEKTSVAGPQTGYAYDNPTQTRNLGRSFIF